MTTTLTPAAPSAADLAQIADIMQRFPWMFPGMDARSRTTVGEVIDKYLDDARGELAAGTYLFVSPYLTRFRDALGSRAAADCVPLDLKGWMTSNAGHMKSGWTKARINAAIQRAFNWAVCMRLTRENPFRGFRVQAEKKTGRDMKPDEFQAVLRHADPPFRRFMIALKLTGARPGELSELTWANIDWQRGVASLAKHKTASKTGKPRVIVLVPQVLKMLAILRRDRHGPAAVELRRILLNAPDRTMRAKEVVHRMRQLGFSYRVVYAARKKVGVVRKRAGGWGEHGYATYTLPDTAPAVPNSEHVFLTIRQRPFDRHTLCQKFRRLKELIGLPDDCKLYGTRHLFATWAVKRGVNLKAVATLLGQTTTRMVDQVYTHLDGDYEYLQKAAQAATNLNGSSRPLPLPDEDRGWQELVAHQFPKATPKEKKALPKLPGERGLIPAEQIAYDAFKFAIAQVPDLASATDLAVFEWLMGRREFAGQLPPTFPTFRRYLHTARKHHEGAAKRAKRRLPPAEEEEQGK